VVFGGYMSAFTGTHFVVYSYVDVVVCCLIGQLLIFTSFRLVKEHFTIFKFLSLYIF